MQLQVLVIPHSTCLPCAPGSSPCSCSWFAQATQPRLDQSHAAFMVNVTGVLGSLEHTSSGPDTLTGVWSTGRVLSDGNAINSVTLPPTLVGKMADGSTFMWSVSLWDGAAWSPIATLTFDTAPSDPVWDSAAWIGGGPHHLCCVCARA